MIISNSLGVAFFSCGAIFEADFEKVMSGTLVVTTGISGSGDKNYLDRFAEYAELCGKKVKIYKTGEMIMRHAEENNMHITPERVLNANDQTMQGIRSAVFEKIFLESSALRNRGYAIIIDMHAWFYWKFLYNPAVDYHYLNLFNPDIYINFINDADSICAELKKREQWRRLLFSDDKPANYGKERVLEWQSVEFGTTKLLAQFSLGWIERDKNGKSSKEPSKRFFVISAKSSESILYRLIFEPWRKFFYLGMPLTLFHDPKYKRARQRIDGLADWLEHYVGCVDPRGVEPLTNKHLRDIDPPVYNHVVERDLHWLIPQCDGMVANFPEVAYSAGVNNEMREMHEQNKEVWLIYPKGKPASPFLVVWADWICRSEREFKIKFKKRLGKKYLAQVERAQKAYNKR